MKNRFIRRIAVAALVLAAAGCRKPATELIPHENTPEGVVSAMLETLRAGDLEGTLSLMPGGRLENHRNAMKKSAEYREKLAPTLLEQLHGEMLKEMKKNPTATFSSIRRGSESAFFDVLLEYSDGSRRMAYCKAILTRDGAWRVEETGVKQW